MAEWLCSGLQIRVRRFDSGLRLQYLPPASGYPSLRPVNRLIVKVTPFSFDDESMHDNQTSRPVRPTLLALSAAALMTLAPLAAEADSGRHHHRHGRGEYKEKYWDGACKVERKWKRNGDYSEKRKCRDDYRYGYAPQPVLVPAMPAPAIVINPPPIIIRP